MDAEQRRQAVERMLAEDPTTSQRSIAKALGVSQASIRRDMAALGIAAVNTFGTRSVTQSGPQPVSSQVTRGDSLVARLRGEMALDGLIPTSVEEEHLATAKDLADRIERLQCMVKADGERRKLKDGRVLLHPALAEIRQCESVLARVIGGIQTMDVPVKNAVKVKAANTRWRAHRLAAVERERRAGDLYGS